MATDIDRLKRLTATRLCGVAIIIFMGNNILHDRTKRLERGECY